MVVVTSQKSGLHCFNRIEGDTPVQDDVLFAVEAAIIDEVQSKLTGIKIKAHPDRFFAFTFEYINLNGEVKSIEEFKNSLAVLKRTAEDFAFVYVPSSF